MFRFVVNNSEFRSRTHCKYHSVNDIQLLHKPKNLHIFHTNVNGLDTKMDNLHEFVSGLPTEMDLAIIETSEKENIGFLNNVEIDGYEIYHTASKSSKWGMDIFVNKSFDSLDHCALNINNTEFETTWIQIKNKK